MYRTFDIYHINKKDVEKKKKYIEYKVKISSVILQQIYNITYA